jgi:hypothetical protein
MSELAPLASETGQDQSELVVAAPASSTMSSSSASIASSEGWETTKKGLPNKT